MIDASSYFGPGDGSQFEGYALPSSRLGSSALSGSVFPGPQFTLRGPQFTPHGSQFTPHRAQLTPHRAQFTPLRAQFSPHRPQFTPSRIGFPTCIRRVDT
jgi:hypothetical protein